MSNKHVDDEMLTFSQIDYIPALGGAGTLTLIPLPKIFSKENLL